MVSIFCCKFSRYIFHFFNFLFRLSNWLFIITNFGDYLYMFVICIYFLSLVCLIIPENFPLPLLPIYFLKHFISSIVYSEFNHFYIKWIWRNLHLFLFCSFLLVCFLLLLTLTPVWWFLIIGLYLFDFYL